MIKRNVLIIIVSVIVAISLFSCAKKQEVIMGYWGKELSAEEKQRIEEEKVILKNKIDAIEQTKIDFENRLDSIFFSATKYVDKEVKSKYSNNQEEIECLYLINEDKTILINEKYDSVITYIDKKNECYYIIINEIGNTSFDALFLLYNNNGVGRFKFIDSSYYEIKPAMRRGILNDEYFYYAKAYKKEENKKEHVYGYIYDIYGIKGKKVKKTIISDKWLGSFDTTYLEKVLVDENVLDKKELEDINVGKYGKIEPGVVYKDHKVYKEYFSGGYSLYINDGGKKEIILDNLKISEKYYSYEYNSFVNNRNGDLYIIDTYEEKIFRLGNPNDKIIIAEDIYAKILPYGYNTDYYLILDNEPQGEGKLEKDEITTDNIEVVDDSSFKVKNYEPLGKKYVNERKEYIYREKEDQYEFYNHKGELYVDIDGEMIKVDDAHYEISSMYIQYDCLTDTYYYVKTINTYQQEYDWAFEIYSLKIDNKKIKKELIYTDKHNTYDAKPAYIGALGDYDIFISYAYYGDEIKGRNGKAVHKKTHNVENIDIPPISINAQRSNYALNQYEGKLYYINDGSLYLIDKSLNTTKIYDGVTNFVALQNEVLFFSTYKNVGLYRYANDETKFLISGEGYFSYNNNDEKTYVVFKNKKKIDDICIYDENNVTDEAKEYYESKKKTNYYMYTKDVFIYVDGIFKKIKGDLFETEGSNIYVDKNIIHDSRYLLATGDVKKDKNYSDVVKIANGINNDYSFDNKMTISLFAWPYVKDILNGYLYVIKGDEIKRIMNPINKVLHQEDDKLTYVIDDDILTIQNGMDKYVATLSIAKKEKVAKTEKRKRVEFRTKNGMYYLGDSEEDWYEPIEVRYVMNYILETEW